MKSFASYNPQSNNTTVFIPFILVIKKNLTFNDISFKLIHENVLKPATGKLIKYIFSNCCKTFSSCKILHTWRITLLFIDEDNKYNRMNLNVLQLVNITGKNAHWKWFFKTINIPFKNNKNLTKISHIKTLAMCRDIDLSPKQWYPNPCLNIIART